MTGIEIATVAGTAVTMGDAMMAVSAIAGAASAMSSGAMSEATMGYNAQLAEVEAINAKNAAAYEEELHRKRGERLLSSQKASIGASGGDMEGSNLLLLGESAQELEKDALAIRYSGTVAAAKSTAQAAADRIAGAAAKTAGYFGAGKSILTGASEIGWSPKTGTGVVD